MAATNNVFRLSLPDGWEENTVYTFQGPLDSGVQHNIVLMIDRTIGRKTGLAEYVRRQMATSKDALPEFEMINEGEKTLPSGLPAREVVYKYVPPGRNVLFQKQLYTIAEGAAYVFTSTFSRKTLATIAHDVDRIIASFKPFAVQEK
jgi:hypothetical protein